MNTLPCFHFLTVHFISGDKDKCILIYGHLSSLHKVTFKSTKSSTDVHNFSTMVDFRKSTVYQKIYIITNYEK